MWLRISTHDRKGAERKSGRIASRVIPSRRTAPHRFAGRATALTGIPLGSGSSGVGHVHDIKSHADRRVLRRNKNKKFVGGTF